MARSKSARTSKKKPKRRSKKKVDDTLFGFERERVFRVLQVIGWLALIGGAISAWVYARPRLERYANNHLASLEAMQIELPPLPAWLDVNHPTQAELSEAEQRGLVHVKQSIVNEITLAARAQITSGIFSREDLLRVRDALDDTGWFRKVDRVERTGPGTVTITAAYVTPFTMVQDDEGNHLVDRSGALLPLSYFSDVRVRNLPLVIGARFTRPPVHGEVWEGRDVEAGLNLAEMILETEWAHQVAAIDVGEFLHTEVIWLTTTNGARILWGRAPGMERGVEVPARQKIAYLDWFYTNHGRVEGRYRELDLTTDRVYAR